MSLTQEQKLKLFEENKNQSLKSNRYKHDPVMSHNENNFNEKIYDIPEEYGEAEEIKDSTFLNEGL